MTYTLVVGAAPVGGEDAFYRALLAEAAHVVAADAGGEWCVRLGRVPEVVIGDFDSAEAGATSRLAEAGIEVVQVAADKDETDLDLALDLALQRFGPPVTLTAAFTARLDHTLASLGTLLRAGEGASAREAAWTAWLCTPGAPLTIEPAAGAIVSVLAPGGAEGVRITGTRWTLDGTRLEMLSGLGVSNEAAGGPVMVESAVGALLVLVGNR